jgi:hypothetical protein
MDNGIAQKIIANPDDYSIDTLTNGVQNGTVPAYIGIPLIQEKMLAQKKQAALMGNAQQENEPPIADQILSEAEQTNGLEGLSTGLPTEGYAPGGIIAFADGGEADDEEDDDELGMSEDEKQLFNILRNRMASSDEYEEMAGIGALPAGVAKAVSTKREVSSKVGNEPKQTKTEGITQLTKEGTPAGDLINKIMQKESGGRRYDKDGNLLTSPKGAQGEMQVMPGTARDPGFGIRPARAGDADDLARVGREYFGKMMDKYGDPKLAAIAYNWGPGNTDKWLMAGADPSKLPRETQKYSADMAAGGRVPGFASGMYMDPMGNPVYGEEPDYSSPIRPGEAISNWMSGMGLSSNQELLKRQEEKKKKEAEKKAAATNISMVNPDEEALAAEKAARYQPPVEPVKAEEPAAVNPMGDYIGDYAAYLKEQRAENTKNKETNKYLALLQAGLGMMGGTSRYAGANIGQGASQGVAAYMAGRKQESADDRALQQGMLGLSRASLYDKMHSEDIKRRLAADKSREGFQKSQLGLKEQELGVNRQKVAALEKAAKAKNAATYGKLFKEFDDTADAAGIKADLAKRYGKKWNEDAKANGEYKLLKAQSIAQMMLGGELDNAIKMSTDY